MELWLLKLDPSGQQEWNISGQEITDYGNPIQTEDGGYFVFSYFRNGFNFTLVRLNATGGYQWNSTLYFWNSTLSPYPAFDFARMIHTLDGGFLAAGRQGEYASAASNAFLLKLNATGAEEWNTSFGGSEPDEVRDVIQIADGSFLLAGSTTSYAFSSKDFWLIKTDSGGNLLWNTTFGGFFSQESYSLIQTADGGFLLAGRTRASYNTDIWLVKTDANGGHVWNATFGDPKTIETFVDEEAFSVFQTADGNFIVASQIYESQNYEVTFDFWLFKFSVSDKSPNGTPGFKFSWVIFSLVVPVIFIRKRRP